jgi:hypothetical protein
MGCCCWPNFFSAESGQTAAHSSEGSPEQARIPLQRIKLQADGRDRSQHRLPHDQASSSRRASRDAPRQGNPDSTPGSTPSSARWVLRVPSWERRRGGGAAPPLVDFGLAETHEPLRKLGQGGTGETWLCRDKRNNTLVAVKLVPRPIPKVLVSMLSHEIRVRQDQPWLQPSALIAD